MSARAISSGSIARCADKSSLLSQLYQQKPSLVATYRSQAPRTTRTKDRASAKTLEGVLPARKLLRMLRGPIKECREKIIALEMTLERHQAEQAVEEAKFRRKEAELDVREPQRAWFYEALGYKEQKRG